MNPLRFVSAALIAAFLAASTVSVAYGSPKEAAGTPGARTSAGAIYQAAAKLTGPITTGHVVEPLSAYPLELASHGYEQKEFFASGTATTFKALSSPSDGDWSIEPTSSASYKTRILVRRPIDASRFNGTVVVEWMNVSEGESAPDWDYLNPELMRNGYAYVGVSAQALGVEGGTPLLGSSVSGTGGGLVNEEPSRYGTLHHPGDQYSFDIFAQIGRALRLTGHPAVLGNLRPKHVVAVGESQSAFYLTTFVDALQPHTHTFDGVFIHSRGGPGAALNGASILSGPSQGLRIRIDTGVPVFMFETQTDLVELGYASASQPNTKRIRTWEVAGTSHADSYIVGPAAGILGCTTPVNDGPQHIVVQAAFAAFDKWVTHGTPPPSPPPFKLAGTHPVTLALDSHGNVIGGVRTPAVDVPVSTLSGAAPKGASAICALFGSTIAFSGSELVSLYRNKPTYIEEFERSLQKAISAGFILSADRADLIAQAEAVSFPS